MAKRYTNGSGSEGPNTNEQAKPAATGASYPAYLTAAARLSTSRPLGASRVDTDILNITDGIDSSALSDESTVAGGAVLDYLPVFGVSADATSALNRSSFYDFNAFRCQISGNRPYEPVDHMLYRQCVDSMRELYYYIARAYSVLATYNATNLYRPRAIFAAMNLNFDDWNKQAARIYQWLRVHKAALNPFPTVPIGSISSRREIFNRYMFTDGDSPTAQTYIFNQVGFYSYEVVDEVKGITIRHPGAMVDDYLDLWDEMYSALQSSSDVYTIAADIRRAYPDKYITELDCPEYNASVEYVKLDPILTSIMNCNTVGINDIASLGLIDDSVLNAFRIYDGGNGILLCTPKINVQMQNDNPAIACGGNLSHFNFVETEPDVNAIISAARLRTVGKFKLDVQLGATNVIINYNAEIESTSTEVVIGARIFANRDDGEIDRTIIHTCLVYDADRAHEVDAAMAKWTVCDWMLPVYVSTSDFGSSNSAQAPVPYEDIQNYVPVTKEIVKDIHNAILMHEFGLPG